MSVILGLGVVYLALGILVMAPFSLGLRKNELMSKALYLGFQVFTIVGLTSVLLAGVLLLTV
ncbi:MAG TPA: hypothetical protein VK464_11465 [Symbiobacteriaceae bacterium]|nr:hypothetical protein [Symbiobacteriaceae bacterium]